MASSVRQTGVMRGGTLDALRFAASMFVVIFHFGDSAPIPLRNIHEIWGRGYLATDFFLLLSGFVLARAYGQSLNQGQVKPLGFWLKRFLRSYPTHLITLGLLILMVLGAGLVGKGLNNPEHFPLSGIPAQIFLLHAFGHGGGEWNIPAWTLSALLICYAFMPFMWRSLSRLPGPITPLALAITLLLAGQILSLHLINAPLFELPYQYALIRAFPLFTVGLLLARSVETGNWTPQRAHGLAGIGAALLVYDILSHGPHNLSLVAISVLTLGCGAYQVTRPIPGAAWGAKVSFTLFMTHTLTGAVYFSGLMPILRQITPLASQGPIAWGLWFAALILALIVADLYNRLIDAPLQRWIRRRWFDKTQPLQAQPASSPISN